MESKQTGREKTWKEAAGDCGRGGRGRGRRSRWNGWWLFEL